MPTKAGEVVIKQGGEGDYFYIIVSGKCAVSRETPLKQEGIKLAELGVGDTFGEEALIAEAKRNATVTMLTDGVLMRLNKQDFRELMNEPLLQWVSASRRANRRQGRPLARRAAAERAPDPRDRGVAEHPAVPDPPEALDARSRYARTSSYCDTGRRSSAAAYLLVERGFDAYVLRGGLSGDADAAPAAQAAAKKPDGLTAAGRKIIVAQRGAGASRRATWCGSPCRPTVRRRDRSRSSSASDRDPAR